MKDTFLQLKISRVAAVKDSCCEKIVEYGMVCYGIFGMYLGDRISGMRFISRIAA